MVDRDARFIRSKLLVAWARALPPDELEVRALVVSQVAIFLFTVSRRSWGHRIRVRDRAHFARTVPRINRDRPDVDRTGPLGINLVKFPWVPDVLASTR